MLGTKTFQTFVKCIKNWQEYIVSDKQVLPGKPIIKETRISVKLVLELFSNGWNEKQILDSYPSVSQESVRAVFAPKSFTVIEANNLRRRFCKK